MERLYSVSSLTAELKEIIETGFRRISLEGEISNSRPASSGHWYFTLKDADAIIGAVMFRNRMGTMRFQPREGMQVLVQGSLSLYEKRGNYQIICESMEEAGQGALLAQLEERKQRLAAEGLFLLERKRAIPLLPKRVAIVTSPTGAAIRDILQVLGRRSAGLDIVILPAPVQGAEAATKLAAQLRRAGELGLGEVVILARGGGSVEDLLPFSDEILVRAVAESKIPVISAVGHETDTSLVDYAADLRAPTPSAAAELVVQSREELLRRVLHAGHAIVQLLLGRYRQAQSLLKPYAGENLHRSYLSFVQPRMMRLDDAKESLVDRMRTVIRDRRHRLESFESTVRALSPWDVLKRGYAAIRDPGGRTIASAATAPTGAIVVQWHDGTATGQLEMVELKKEDHS